MFHYLSKQAEQQKYIIFVFSLSFFILFSALTHATEDLNPTYETEDLNPTAIGAGSTREAEHIVAQFLRDIPFSCNTDMEHETATEHSIDTSGIVPLYLVKDIDYSTDSMILLKIFLEEHDSDPEDFMQFKQGTGFFINETGLLVTAFHNIEYLKGSVHNIVFRDPKTKTLHAFTEIIALDPKADTAILKVEGYKPNTVYPLGEPDKLNRTSQSIIIAGCPNNTFSVFQGTIRERSLDAWWPLLHFAHKKQHHGEDLGGASGSPVFFENGDLAGVMNKSSKYKMAFAGVENLSALLQNDSLSCTSSACVQQALDQLLEEAKRGNKEAQFAIGEKYRKKREYALAFEWYERASTQGLVRAQVSVGMMYQLGRGVPQDSLSAIKRYELASKQNSVQALMFSATIYADGLNGIDQDWVKSVHLFEQAAELGDYHAQMILYEIYMSGEGVPQDFEKASYWRKKMAEQDGESVSWPETTPIGLLSILNPTTKKQ